jgi:hypothetical protein
MDSVPRNPALRLKPRLVPTGVVRIPTSEVRLPNAQARRPLPPMKQRALSMARDLVRWGRAGFPVADQAELARRKAICLDCDHWDPKLWAPWGGCRLCGCSQAKLWLATAQCKAPKPKWVGLPG